MIRFRVEKMEEEYGVFDTRFGEPGSDDAWVDSWWLVAAPPEGTKEASEEHATAVAIILNQAYLPHHFAREPK